MKIFNQLPYSFLFTLSYLLLTYLYLFSPLECRAEEQSYLPGLSSFVISPTEIAPGGNFYCSLTFTNQGEIPSRSNDYVFLHLTDLQDRNQIRWQYDHEPSIPTRFWIKGQSIEEGPFPCLIPETMEEGSYGVRVGLWNPSTNFRSYDQILPVTFTVRKNAKLPELLPVQSIGYDEARRINQTLYMERFSSKSFIELANRRLRFQFQPQEGLFCIRDQQTGALWQSAPNAAGLGYIMAENDENQTIRIPLNEFTVVSASKKKCSLKKEYNKSLLMELEIALENHLSSLSFSWKFASHWKLHRLDWTSLAWTTDALGGGAVIPRLMGEYFPVDHPQALQLQFGTYSGWSGLHVPLSAMLQWKNCLMLSWDNPYFSIQLHSREIPQNSSPSQSPGNKLPEFKWPGIKLMALDLQSTESTGKFQFTSSGGNSYLNVANAYREIAKTNGLLIGMDQKIKKNPELHKLLGAAEFKPLICIRFMTEKDQFPDGRVENPYSEQDCIQLIRHLHDDLGLSKVLFVLAGWNHRGYDNQHPDILPAAKEIGGDDGVIRISEFVRANNYLFGLHDNYQDIYADSPSWDASLLMIDREGKYRKGGIWAGGQSWLMASDHGLEFAHRNLPEIKNLFSPNAYFIDTTYAAPLYDSFAPNDPMTRHDDLKFKRELSRFAANLFGIHGSETGMAFGVPESHFLEGILSGKPLVKDFPNPTALEIPLFSLLFHDCITMYPHQGDRVGIGDARKILNCLIHGAMPLYDIPPHPYWKTRSSEPDLNDPNFSFVRYQGGWGEDQHPVDRFIKNTYEFLSPFCEAVATIPMTDHRFLKEDRSVESSHFGDHWQVVVNYGPNDYQYGQTILPAMGFLVLGPEFLAQHFYPRYGTSRTSLIVKKGAKSYLGFQ